MRLEFRQRACEDFQYWVSFHPKTAKRILKIIEGNKKNPFGGIGKPEPLKENFSGWWSKRINGEHRLIYRVEGDFLIIAQAKGHYG